MLYKMKKNLKQKLINLAEYYSLNNANLLLSDIPLKRNANNAVATLGGTKLQKLTKLKKNIQLIKNCAPGPSPIIIIFALVLPSPKTKLVAFFFNLQFFIS